MHGCAKENFLQSIGDQPCITLIVSWIESNMVKP